MSKTIRDLIIEILKDKYFQKISTQDQILQIIGIHRVIDSEEAESSAYLMTYDVIENWAGFPISFDHLDIYKVLSEKEVNKILKKNNKANLSEKEYIKFNTKHENYKSLAVLAKDINETAIKNRDNLSSDKINLPGHPAP